MCREDLAFWLDALQYVTKLDYQSAEDAEKLIQTVEKLDIELMEVDFGKLIEYLKDVRVYFM